MKISISKLALSAVFSCIIGVSAFADMDDRLDVLEKEMQEISARNPQETLGTSFVTARPEVIDSNWFITFDITYWHTKMGGTEYAYSVDRFNIIDPIPLDGDTKDNDFDWDVGIKVGLGYKLPQHDDWDVYARYTWFDTDNTSSSAKAGPSALISLTWWNSVIASHAKSHIDLDYDNVELELGRSYFISRKIAFRPHFGIKSAWINYDRTAVFTASGLAPAQVDTEGLDYKTKEHLKFWGVGPRAGLDSKWFLGYGFNLFGDVATSILYGYFNTVHKDYFPPHVSTEFLPGGLVNKIKHKFHRFILFLQMALGLEWNTDLNNQKQHLGLKLGYEVQYYWRVNQMHQSEDRTFNSSSTGLQFEKQTDDLMYYGITGEFRLDF